MGMFNFKKEVTVPQNENPNGNYSSVAVRESIISQSTIKEDKRIGVYAFGERNDYPDKLVELYDKSPTNQAIINRTALMIAGDDVVYEKISEKMVDHIHSEMLIRYPNKEESLQNIILKVAHDIKLHGRFAIEVNWNADHSKVTELKHVDVKGVRIGILSKENEVEFYKHSEDWNDRRKEVTTFEKYDKNGKSARQLIYFQFMRSGHSVYGLPDYYASTNWIELEALIGESNSDGARNGFSPKVAVIFPSKPNDSYKEKQIMNNLNAVYSGALGRKIMGIFAPRPELKPEIVPLNVDQLHNQYKETDAQAERKILTGHGVVSPTLFGISSSNGFSSNTDELLASYKIYQKTVVSPYTKIIERTLNRIFEDSGNMNKLIITPYTL